MANRPAADGGRTAAIERYLQLRPAIRARMEASVPADLQEEFTTVTAHQLRALVVLGAEGQTMRQLAAAMGVMGATASVLADRLVGQGLADRCADPRDRRVVRLVPTERGRLLSERYLAAERRTAETLFARLTDRQVTAWLDVLETLAADDEVGDRTAPVRATPAPGAEQAGAGVTR